MAKKKVQAAGSALKAQAKRMLVAVSKGAPSILRQCELLGLSRSSYYRSVQGTENDGNLDLMNRIDELYTKYPFYGSRKMRDHLRREGRKVNRKRIQRLMRLMGLQSVAPKPNTSKPQSGHKIYPYLLRNLEIKRPMQVLSMDITYIRLQGGFVYLTAVIDWYSRCVLSWEVSNTMDDAFCVNAMRKAIDRFGVPEISNTDQGSQFTGKAFIGQLKEHDIKISMDGKSRALDNIFVERLWRTVKYEDVYLKDYATMSELVAGLKRYFDYYNHERPHQSLKGRTPMEVHQANQWLVQAA